MALPIPHLTALFVAGATGASVVAIAGVLFLADTTGASPTPTGVVQTGVVEDLSGPCDELEHATDPRCTGVRPLASASATTVPTAQATSVPTRAPRASSSPTPRGTASAQPSSSSSSQARDLSGPCDEAEHAGDPRCTGVVPSASGSSGSRSSDDGDHSGRGSDDGGNSGRNGDSSGHRGGHH